mmetsp:Transcript_27032/g.85994  ORF Transcript_27032/g.85994 Transcript_27032/m.85994 type:complete len:260 (-) Transcript_27032:60-839(-)
MRRRQGRLRNRDGRGEASRAMPPPVRHVQRSAAAEQPRRRGHPPALQGHPKRQSGRRLLRVYAQPPRFRPADVRGGGIQCERECRLVPQGPLQRDGAPGGPGGICAHRWRLVRLGLWRARRHRALHDRRWRHRPRRCRALVGRAQSVHGLFQHQPLGHPSHQQQPHQGRRPWRNHRKSMQHHPMHHPPFAGRGALRALLPHAIWGHPTGGAIAIASKCINSHAQVRDLRVRSRPLLHHVHCRGPQRGCGRALGSGVISL